MGRYYYNKKQEADSLEQVNVSFLKKRHYFDNGARTGYITWSRRGEKIGEISIQSYIFDFEQYIRFIYTQTNRHTGEKHDFDYKIPLTTTSCHFGGKRYWFICPWYINGVYCGKRVGALYLADKYLACRHCYNLTYNSRNLGGISKMAGQVISKPELEELENTIKIKYYAGRKTRRYKRYLKKSEKADRQFMFMVGHLQAGGACKEWIP